MNSPHMNSIKALGKLLPFLVTGLLGGCTAFNYAEPDAPLGLRLDQASPMHPAPRIALVLGSGGPRGYAHLGIWAFGHLGIFKVLEEAGIVPDLVVGSSVGALIGTFWADGLTAAQLTEQALGGDAENQGSACYTKRSALLYAGQHISGSEGIVSRGWHHFARRHFGHRI
jgi:hypothetical protein